MSATDITRELQATIFVAAPRVTMRAMEEIDRLRAEVATLTRERDETRAEARMWKQASFDASKTIQRMSDEADASEANR